MRAISRLGKRAGEDLEFVPFRQFLDWFFAGLELCQLVRCVGVLK